MSFDIASLKCSICMCVFLILNISPTIRGCKLFYENGTEVNFESGVTKVEVNYIADRITDKLVFTYTTQDVIGITEVVTSKYMKHEFVEEKISVYMTDAYDTWEMDEPESFDRGEIIVNLECAEAASKQINFVARIDPKQYTNNYAPLYVLPDGETNYEVTLPMPLGAGYVIAGGCGMTIDVIDYDYHSTLYKSSLAFESQGDDMGIQASAVKTSDKSFSVSLVTTSTINVENPFSFELIVNDVAPPGKTEESLQSRVTVTIIPNITASTPLSPVFTKILHPVEVNEETSLIDPLTLEFTEGYNKDETTIEVTHGTGTNIAEYFTIENKDVNAILEQIKPFDDAVLNGNYGVLVLEAKREGNDRAGKAVIHIALPGNPSYPTTTTTEPSIPTVDFKDDNAFVYVFKNIPGPIFQVYATSSMGEEVKYELSEGEMIEHFVIDEKSGILEIKDDSIEEDTIVKVKASTSTANAEAKINILMMDLTCEDGENKTLGWENSLEIRNVEEGEQSVQPYSVCPRHCSCDIIDFFPNAAKDYISIRAGEVWAIQELDCEDETLFTDIHHTEIVLQINAKCTDLPYFTSVDAETSQYETAFDKIKDFECKQTSVKRLVIDVKNIDEFPPEFKNYDSPVTIGYPNKDIIESLLPPYLMKVEATDKDLGINTKLYYELQNSNEFDIESDTGIVNPVPGVFKYEEASFIVNVKDQSNYGLQVNVVILDEKHLCVIKVKNKLLNEVDTILNEISESTGYTIRSLSATLIVGEDSRNGNYIEGDVNSKTGSRKHIKRSVTKASTSFIHLVVYGLNKENEVVSSSDIVSKINNNGMEVDALAWSSSGSSTSYGDEVEDNAPVIALGVIVGLLAIALASFVVLYIRLRRNNKAETNHDISTMQTNKFQDHDIENRNPLTEVQIGKSNGTYEPPLEKPPISPTNGDIKLENKAWAILRDFDEGATDEYKRGISREDVPADSDNDGNLNSDGRRMSDTSFRNEDDGSETGSLNGRKKSVVTFNANVERIEID